MTDLVRCITNELADCRQRGIERLDLKTHNQVPVTAPELEILAREHAGLRRLSAVSRGTQIKYLLWDALSAMRQQDSVDAELVSALFFGEAAERDSPGSPAADPAARDPAPRDPAPRDPAGMPAVAHSAGELLDRAQRKSGLSESRFRERRAAAFASFSGFLVQFCAATTQTAPETAGAHSGTGTRSHGTNDQSVSISGSASHPAGIGASPDDLVDLTGAARPLRAGHVENGERFVELLSEAVNVTIVGFTNENLPAMMESALTRKRAALGDPDAFWASLRIVFFSGSLLDSITDERSEYPDQHEAFRQRRLAAIHGRRAVTVFLRRIRTTRWTIYEAPFVPPFIGTLFEFGTGRRIVHLIIRHPHRNAPDHLYLEIDETSDQYFSSVFEEVVHSSVDDSKVVAIGLPRENTFQTTGTRYWYNVLRDSSGTVGWLPYVLLVTWRVRAAGPEPLLQLRTEANAVRSLDRLTHLATHIFLDDFHEGTWPETPAIPAAISLDSEAPRHAGRRRLYTEAGEDLPGEFIPVGTDEYLHHDKEHLFFLVYSREVPGDFQFPRRANMYPVPLQELIAILGNQALRKAASLFAAPAMPRRFFAAAVEMASLNLALHGHAELSAAFGKAARSRRLLDDELAATLQREIDRTRQSRFSSGREVEIQGLSGLHYRAFFTLLLPLYARIGVPGAAGYLDAVRSDPSKAAAIARLSEIYHDEELTSVIPLEL